MSNYQQKNKASNNIFPESLRFKDLSKSIIFKHGIVSMISAIIDFGLFTIMVEYLEKTIFLSHLLGFSTATIFGFYAHSFFTFEINKIEFKRLLLFIVQIILVFNIGLFLLEFMVDIGFEPTIAKPIQLFFTFFLNITIGKKITFIVK